MEKYREIQRQMKVKTLLVLIFEKSLATLTEDWHGGTENSINRGSREHVRGQATFKSFSATDAQSYTLRESVERTDTENQRRKIKLHLQKQESGQEFK